MCVCHEKMSSERKVLSKLPNQEILTILQKFTISGSSSLASNGISYKQTNDKV